MGKANLYFLFKGLSQVGGKQGSLLNKNKNHADCVDKYDATEKIEIQMLDPAEGREEQTVSVSPAGTPEVAMSILNSQALWEEVT